MKRILPAIFAALVGTTLVLSVAQRANAAPSDYLAQRYPQDRNYDYGHHHRNRHDDYWDRHRDRHHDHWRDRLVHPVRRDRDVHRDWRDRRHHDWR